MDGIALKPLTVDFHEPGFVAKLSSENQFGPWFTLSDKEKQQLGSPMGPQNPQSLNRYSYVLNNPITGMDPSGHWTFSINVGATAFFGSGGGGTLSIAIDTEGTIAFIGGLNGGISTGVAVSAGPSISVTNAPSVFDLKGNSSHLGVIGGEGIAASGEMSWGSDRNGNTVIGVTIGGNATFAASPPAIPGVAYYVGEH